MPDVKFGFGQTSNPTPSKLNLWVRVLTVVAAIFMGWMGTNNLIGVHSQAVISSLLGLFLALINGLAPLFGVDVPTKYVKAESVTAIDTSNKP